jgi:RimJ/RimL family protein N-acetyltransferase
MTEDGNLFVGQLLRLAAPEEEDAAEFARWSQDAVYLRALDTDYARPLSARQFTARFGPQPEHDDPHGIEFRLRTLADNRLIGFVALHSIEWNNQAARLSIGIGEAAYRGKGYGRDALNLTLRYAFHELNLYRVGLDVIADNEPAIRAYERAGFRQEGAVRGAVLRDGRRHDLIMMGLLRDEWLAARPTITAARAPAPAV